MVNPGETAEAPKVYIRCTTFLDASAVGDNALVILSIPGEPVHKYEAGIPPDGGVIEHTVEKTAGGAALLEQLINSPLSIEVCSKASREVLGSTTVDLLGLTAGVSRISKETAVIPTPQATARSGDAPVKNVTLTVQVEILRLKEAAKGAASGQLPGGKGAVPVKKGAAPIAVIPLPEDLEPLCLLAPKDAADAVLLEVGPRTASPLPPRLEGAHEAAGGQLAFMAAISLPCAGDELPAPIIACPGGRLRDGCIHWEGAATRMLLHSATVSALREHLEAGRPVPLELARVITPPTDMLYDPAFPAYHGCAWLDCGHLLRPGATTVSARIPVLSPAGSGHQTGQARSQAVVIPSLLPPTSKARAIEDAAGNPAEVCAWQQSGTHLDLTLTLSKPLYPAWMAPAKPSKTLHELVPRHEVPKAPYRTAKQRLHDELSGLAHQLLCVAEKAGASELPASCLEAAGPRLFALVRNMAAEMRRDGEQVTTSDLYSEVMLQLQAAVQAANSVNPAIPHHKDAGKERSRLMQLASQEECAGNAAASKMHHTTLCAQWKDDPEVWHNFGEFCLRTGDLPLAEQCLREALALDPSHKMSLLVLGCLFWHLGSVVDPCFLADAESPLFAATQCAAGYGLAWALLGLVKKQRGLETDARNCASRATELGSKELQPYSAHLEAAALLVKLKLEACAEIALHVSESPPWEAPALQLETLLLRAQAASLLGRPSDAVAAIERVVGLAESSDARPHIVLADVHHAAGESAKASQSYLQALHVDPRACSLHVFVRLGEHFLNKGHFEDACNVYGQGCEVLPCCQTWLGSGVAHLRAGDYDAADEALCEANRLDVCKPEVWGWLALLAGKRGLKEEASAAVHLAFQHGLRQVELVREIGEEFFHHGWYGEAEGSLRRAQAMSEDTHISRMIGDTLTKQQKLEDALPYYKMAASEGLGDDKTHSQKQIAVINQQLGIA